MKNYKSQIINKMKKIFSIQTFVILTILLLPSLVHAQPGFGDDVGDAPIDGGLSLLVAAGIGYGAKKLAAKRKLNNNEEK
jgi:hypothetical protein